MKNINNAVAKWSWDENKQFEVALAELLSQDDAHHHQSSPDFFHRIAMRVAGKSAGEIEDHYRALEEDVERIDAGGVPLPEYADDDDDDEGMAVAVAEKKAARLPRKVAVPWTAEEHQLFLKGLNKYGKGDWRSISRNCVITRTPTQVASHAQKYFNGLMQSKSKGSNNSRPRKHHIKSKYSA